MAVHTAVVPSRCTSATTHKVQPAPVHSDGAVDPDRVIVWNISPSPHQPSCTVHVRHTCSPAHTSPGGVIMMTGGGVGGGGREVYITTILKVASIRGGSKESTQFRCTLQYQGRWKGGGGGKRRH